jgi:hypothetical protein
MIRDNKGKRRKLPKNPVDVKKPPHAFGKPSRPDGLMVSKLQNESLQMLGDPLDAKRTPSGGERR